MKMKSRKLKLVFGLLATQIDEITIRSSENGWNVKAVDPSHTSMISMEIPATEFVDYKQTEDFAISLKNVNKALANAGEECEMEVTEGLFILESDGLKSKFPLITVAENDPRIPSIEYDSLASVPVGEITRICSAVFGTVDAYVLEIKDSTFYITAEDTSKNGVSLAIAKDKCLDIKGEAKSMFAIELLDRLLKALPKDAIIDINIGNDVPLTADMCDADIKVKYLLAPRIESE